MDIEAILDKVGLAGLVERAGGSLKKSGDGWRGACPLHGGDNPTAFSVYRGRNGRERWHCYTNCGDGDAVDFVRLWHRLPDGPEGFVEAMRILAGFSGVPLDEVGVDAETVRQVAERRQERQRRQDLLKMAADYYAGVLRSPSGEQGLQYARGRGWTDETIEGAGLGYGDGQLLVHLRETGVDLALARDTGLVYERSDGQLADAIPQGYLVYAHRLHGRVTYLSGRATFTNEQDKKSRNLRASKRLFWALQRCPGAPLVIVEGQACALTAWQWGYDAVALCGASLDEQDVESIQTYQAVYLALDADAGGKVQGVADRLGPLAMIVDGLPDHDLNAWLQAGGTREDMAKLMDAACPWIEVAVERAGASPVYELEDHLDHLAQLVAALPQGTRGRYVREICDRKRLSTRQDFRTLLAAYDRDLADSSGGFEVQDGRLACYGDHLCNFQARITHELIQCDGMNPPTVVYTVEGSLDSNEKLEPVEVRAEDFDPMRWIARHWGARPIVYVPPGRTYQLRRAIQEVSREDMKRERVHTFTGWAEIEGRRLYLTTSGGLGAEGLDVSVRVDLGSNNLGRYALPSPPADLRTAIKASLDFLALAPYQVTVPLWAAMYAAPLSPIKTVNAVLWVYGVTQSGKSTLSHLALSHFGPTFVQGHEYRAPKDWTSTPTDLERAMFVTKDAPVIIDDYAPAHSGATEARALARKAHYVVRSVGNRSSRGRANADLSERQQRPPRGLVIATAENPLIGQSIVGRMIYVPVEPGQVIQADGKEREETLLDAAQQKAVAGLYAQAMSGYVVWLARRWEQLKEEFPVRIEKASKVGRGIFPSSQSRLTDYYGLLTATLQLALEYAADHGAIAGDDVDLLHERFRVELVDLLRSQGERVQDQSPVVKFWEALSDLVAQDKIYFAPRLNGATFVPPDHADLVGWYDDGASDDDGRIYLLTNAALSHVKGYWQSLDERFDTLSDALRRELWQQGYVPDRDGRNIEKKPYINREVGRKRVLILDARALREKAGVVVSSGGHEDLADEGDEYPE